MNRLRHTPWMLTLAVAGIAAAGAPALTLVNAARTGDAQVVRSLLQQKNAVDVNETAVDGTTALHWAVQRDDTKMVEMLIRSGANAHAANRYGVRPLALAAVNGNADILKLLLDAGADPNAGLSPDETAVMAAARTGKIDALKLLLDHGGRLDARDARGQTALMWAAAKDNGPAVRLLVEAGADINVRTNNPPKGGRYGEMSVFNSPAPTGFTALLFAVRAGSIKGTRALLDAGANVNETLSDGEKTVHSRRPNLGYTPGPVPTGSVDSVNLVRKMIARGVKLDARMTKNGMKDGQRNRVNRLGATAFFLAAKNTDLEVMKVLAEAGAGASIPSADGTTPLMVAAGLGMWYVGEDGGSLPGQEGEALEAVKLCVALGNDVNATNAAGETPMHGGAFRGVNPIVEFLVEKGAKLDPRDSRGWTPFTVANGISYGDVFKQQPQTAELLKEMMRARGLFTEGQAADGTECLDCIQTHADQARAALERDRRMEAEFAKTEAERAAFNVPKQP